MKKILLCLALILPFMSFSQAFEYPRTLSEIQKFRIDSWVPDYVIRTFEFSPWISGDGLRLYYLTGRMPDEGHIQFTSRPHPDSLFKKTPLKILVPGTDKNITTIWLSYDELDLYYTSVQSWSEPLKVYHSHRKDMFSPFETPAMISFTGREIPGFSVPSLDASQEHLYCNSSTTLFEFIKTSLTTFALKDSTVLPQPTFIRPGSYSSGQLSKDGLSYILSANYGPEFPLSRIFGTYKITRGSTQDKFSIDSLFTIGIPGTRRPQEASFSNNEDYVVFISFDHYANEDTTIHLFTARKKSIVTSNFNNAGMTSAFKIYPNTTTGKFSISTQTTDILEVEIYNSLGNKVYQNHSFNGAQSREIDLTGQANGVFIVKVTDRNRSTAVEKVVVE